MVIQGLYVCKHTHRVRVPPHGHHVVHFNQANAVCFLLCSGEGQIQVAFVVSRVQFIVVKLIREEGVDQSTESHSINPAGGEVINVYVLVADGFGAAPL